MGVVVGAAERRGDDHAPRVVDEPRRREAHHALVEGERHVDELLDAELQAAAVRGAAT
jgi:hypothetical protein